MSPANRRRALDELEAVGQEDPDERASGGIKQPLDRHAVDAQLLAGAGLEADADDVRVALLVARVNLHPHERGAEPHHLAIVGGAARPPDAAEVEALEEVRLAGAVAPRHHRETRAERDLRPLVAAEVAQGHGLHPHTLSLMGMIR